MTLDLGGTLIETDDSIAPRDAGDDRVTVRIKDGQNWNGNVFNGCELTIPLRLLVDAAKRA